MLLNKLKQANQCLLISEKKICENMESHAFLRLTLN